MDTYGDPNYLSNDSNQIVADMLADQPSFTKQDNASTVYTNTPPGSQPLPTELATDRAGRYSFATAKVDPDAYGSSDPSTFYTGLINGTDNDMRSRYGQIEANMMDGVKSDETKQILGDALPTQRPLTPLEMDTIHANSMLTPPRPDTVFERMFANNAVQTAITQPKIDADHTVLQAQDVSKPATAISLDFASRAIERQQYAAKLLEEVQARQTYAGTAIDLAEGFIPTLNSFLTHNLLNKSGGTAWLPGDNMKETQDYYYSMPDDQYALALNSAVKGLEANNPSEAAGFLSSLMLYSGNSQLWGNLQPAIDASALLPIGALKKAFNPLAKLAKVGQTAAVATAGTKVTATQALSALGEVVQPGMINSGTMASRLSGATPALNTMKGIDGEAPRFFLPETTLGAPTSADSSELTQAVAAMKSENAQTFQKDVLRGGLRVDRLTGPALEAAKDEADRLFRLQYDQANDAIMGVRLANKEDNLTNNDFIEVTLGKTNKEYFDRAGEAANFAKDQLGIDNARIRVMGDNKFAIIVSKPIDETSGTVRTALDIQTKNATPISKTNPLFGWMKGGQALTSEEQTTDRVVAAYGASQLAKVAKQFYQPVGNLGRGEYKDMVKYLSHERDFIDPITGQRGKFSADPGEFQRNYQSYHGKPPSDKQTLAYEAHQQLSDFDWVMRNLSVYTLKARKGVENFHFDYGGAAPMKMEGKFVDNVDWEAPRDARIAVIEDNTPNNVPSQIDPITGEETGYVRSKNFMRGPARKIFKDAIESGEYKVIKPTDEGLRNFWNAPELDLAESRPHVDYFLVRSPKTTALELKQIPYRPGGHVEYANGTHFLRQPQIEVVGNRNNRSRFYKGDTTVRAFDTEAKAQKFLPRYEEARRLLAESKKGMRPESDVADYLEANLPDSLKDFKSMFDKNPDGPQLNVNEPFYTTPKGKNVGDMVALDQRFKDNIPFLGDTQNPHAIFSAEDRIKFTGQKDSPLLAIKERGTADQPLINFKQASLLDPISTMDRAASSMMRGRYLDDVKLKYAEHYISEFSDVLATPYRDSVNDPFRALVSGEFKTDYPDLARLAAAKNYRATLVNFLGLRNEEGKTFDWIRQQLADSIYKRGGDEKLDLVAPYLLHTEQNPTRFYKQFAFHSKLGLFNPKQILLQGQAVSNTAAIEGFTNASKGVGAGMLQIGLEFNPAHLEYAAGMAAKAGWNAQEFKEATIGLQRSGFMNIGREVQLQDGFLSPRLRNSKVGKFLDWGAAPFNAGEKIARSTAWNAAYLRWRGANPGVTFTDNAVKEVLARANILTQNMSVANAASWQYGLKSVPTQFWSYRMRLAEQMLGKQLTNTEKAKLFGMNAALYGVPIGATTALPFAPISDWVKETANSYGHNIDDSVVEKIVNDGIVSNVIQAMTGVDTDVEETMGPGAITQPYDFMKGNITWTTMLGGASGTVFGDIIANSIPFFSSMSASLRDQEMPGQNLTTQDVMDLASTISTVSQVRKAWMAVNYGKYYTKNQAALVDVDPNANWAILQGVFGLGPQESKDLHAKMANIEDREGLVKAQSNEAMKNFRLAWDALAAKDGETANKYFARAKRAMDWGGLTFTERAQVLQRAGNNSSSVVDSIDWKWAKTSDDRLKALQKEREGK